MEILDEVPHNIEEELKKIKKQEKLFLRLAIFLAVINGTLLAMTHRSGTKPFTAGHYIGNILGAFIWCIVLGFVLGTLYNFIPLGRLTYKQRYWRNVFLMTFMGSILTFIIMLIEFIQSI